MANSYTFSADQRVTIGNATKKTDIDTVAANTDYLKEALDTIMSSSAANGVLTATSWAPGSTITISDLVRFEDSSAETSQYNSGAIDTVTITNSNTTANNWAGILFNDSAAGAGITAIQTKYTDHTNNYGELHFSTRGASGIASRVVINEDGNVGVGTTSFGASAAGVLAIANGTQGAALANAIQLISEDLSAGNTIPSIRTEGSGIYSAGTPAAATGSIAMKINGTVYYFTVSTTAAS